MTSLTMTSLVINQKHHQIILFCHLLLAHLPISPATSHYRIDPSSMFVFQIDFYFLSIIIWLAHPGRSAIYHALTG